MYLLEIVYSSQACKLLDWIETSTHFPWARLLVLYSLLYIYHFGFCSQDLAFCIPLLLVKPWSTWQTTASYQLLCGHHDVYVYFCTLLFWNFLSSYVFPNTYELFPFKREVFYLLKNPTFLFFFDSLFVFLFAFQDLVLIMTSVHVWSFSHKTEEKLKSNTLTFHKHLLSAFIHFQNCSSVSMRFPLILL